MPYEDYTGIRTDQTSYFPIPQYAKRPKLPTTAQDSLNEFLRWLYNLGMYGKAMDNPGILTAMYSIYQQDVQNRIAAYEYEVANNPSHPENIRRRAEAAREKISKVGSHSTDLYSPEYASTAAEYWNLKRAEEEAKNAYLESMGHKQKYGGTFGGGGQSIGFGGGWGGGAERGAWEKEANAISERANREEAARLAARQGGGSSTYQGASWGSSDRGSLPTDISLNKGGFGTVGFGESGGGGYISPGGTNSSSGLGLTSGKGMGLGDISLEEEQPKRSFSMKDILQEILGSMEWSRRAPRTMGR